MNLWEDVKQFFEVDDGLLPEIYIERLSNHELVSAYEWIMSRCTVARTSSVWSIEQQTDICITELCCPAQDFVEGRIESFRHGLADLHMDGVLLPELSVCIDQGTLSFDYRPGADWNEQAVLALFSLLRAIKTLAPNASVFHANEGCYETPNPEFAAAFTKFVAAH
jgi:hypothetical protein